MKHQTEILFAAVLLSVLTLSADIKTTSKEVKRGNNTFKETNYLVTLPNTSLRFGCTVNLANKETSWAVYPAQSRWQRHIFWPGKGMFFGENATVWDTQNDARAMTGIRIPYLKNGKADGFADIIAATLKEYPDWVFYRYTNIPSVYLGPALTPQPITKHKRQLFMMYQKTTLAVGETIPWNNTLPGFNALASFSRGGEEDNICQMLVFDTSCLKKVSTTRWRKNDDRFSLSFQTNEDTILFATGVRINENAEKVTAPQFLAEEQQKILSALKSIRWDFDFDFIALKKEYNDVRELLKKTPNAELQKKYDSLKMPSGFALDDKIQGVSVLNELTAIKKTLSGSQLKDLFQ